LGPGPSGQGAPPTKQPENGQIDGYQIVNGEYKMLNAEALRVVTLFPAEFVPGEKNGRKVKSIYREPVVFRLE
jgi:hypothetical protein